MQKGKILLFTLVHPDFLPPVYAVAQVLRDLGYAIHILTFDSFVPAELDFGSNIELEPVGKHYEVKTWQRVKLRRKFTKRAIELIEEDPVAIISFCPFSFNTGLKIKNKTPLIYHALEISDFAFKDFLKSPMSFYRNLRTIQTLHKADLVATPSLQRSAWLAGRCNLKFMPFTILNTCYYVTNEVADSRSTFDELVPAAIREKKILLYTGAVNAQQCTAELVQAFDKAGDPGSALIITGVRENEYGKNLRTIVDQCTLKNNILLFPYLTRAEMLSLQSYSHIGVFLSKEYYNRIQSKMVAPNKVGEYMGKGLYLLGVDNDYLKPFEFKGIATLAESLDIKDISCSITKSLAALDHKEYKDNINEFVRDYFCMQQQLAPIINFISNL